MRIEEKRICIYIYKYMTFEYNMYKSISFFFSEYKKMVGSYLGLHKVGLFAGVKKKQHEINQKLL